MQGTRLRADDESFPSIKNSRADRRYFASELRKNNRGLYLISLIHINSPLLLVEKFDAIKIFSICVAMFFVLVFSHIDIRSKTSAQEIFYLEYFFFLTYGSILFVALDSIGALLTPDISLFRTNSRIPQLLFWPVLRGILFAVIVAAFFKWAKPIVGRQ